jgi:hypothetical protein
VYVFEHGLRCAQIFGNDERKNVLYEYEIGYLVELYFGSYVYIFSNDYVDVLQHVDTDDDIYGNVDGLCSNDVYNECLIGEVVGDMPVLLPTHPVVTVNLQDHLTNLDVQNKDQEEEGHANYLTNNDPYYD